MRKFFVCFRVYKEYDNLNYTKEIELNPGEKANVETFRNKFKDLGLNVIGILGWSLIEE